MSDDERIDLFLEDRLSPEERERFQSDVVSDPDLRTLYVERAWLHGQLHAEGSRIRALAEEPVPVPFPGSRPLPWLLPAAALFAVLALVTAASWFRPTRPAAPVTVAVLLEANGCKWAGSELPTAQGARLGPGTLALAEGMATLRFDNGATLTMEAPTTLEILDHNRCRLAEGSLVADVPESAHGFTVDTPEMKVVDLGTRFGVTTSGVGNSHVLVFEGEVEVATRDQSEEPRRLTTGHTLHLGQLPAPPSDQEIHRLAAVPTAADGWIHLSTAYGQGKDAYVRRGDSHGPTGSHPLLMVKHTDLAPKNERRAFLTFDLSGLPEGELTGAELVLDVEPSGLGFSALIPDSRFTLHGILDDAFDAWDEATLLWDDAPAVSDAGPLPGQTRELASFEIRRGAAPALIQVSGPALLEFLRNDKNRLASFVLVRDTGESETQGLVHAFASKEHPTARPPTLRLHVSPE